LTAKVNKLFSVTTLVNCYSSITQRCTTRQHNFNVDVRESRRTFAFPERDLSVFRIHSSPRCVCGHLVYKRGGAAAAAAVRLEAQSPSVLVSRRCPSPERCDAHEPSADGTSV